MTAERITKKDAEAANVNRMLNAVEADLEDRDRCNEFIDSIRIQWDKWGSLTQKQVDGLESFYVRIDP